MINNEVNYLYPLEDDIKTKIEKIATKIYRATEVEFSIDAIEKIEKIEKMGYSNLPVCIAKNTIFFYQMMQKIYKTKENTKLL